MKLVELFKEERIFPDLSDSNISNVLETMLSCVNGSIDDDTRKAIHAQLLQQETAHPTLLNANVWVPHLRAPGVQQHTVCLGVSQDGIAMKSLDQSVVKPRLIFMVLTPAYENTRMLQTLAAIARLCMNRDVIEALLHVRSPQRAIRIITETGIDIKRTVLVSDVVQPPPPQLKITRTIREALEIILSSGVEACPVVSEQDELIGELSIREIVRLGLPEYMDILEDVTFIESLEPFENFFRQERQLQVEQVYTQDILRIEPDKMIVQAAHLMIMKGCNHIYVVQDKKVTGMVTLLGIVKKILLL